MQDKKFNGNKRTLFSPDPTVFPLREPTRDWPLCEILQLTD